jgi:transcriptional regulator with XRE-family HTH domain
MSGFARNFNHLLGLHLLTATLAKEHLELSAQAISELKAGKRQPSLRTLQKISAFFEIPIDRLLDADFEDLLANELADRERFRRVEAKIGRRQRNLRAV